MPCACLAAMLRVSSTLMSRVSSARLHAPLHIPRIGSSSGGNAEPLEDEQMLPVACSMLHASYLRGRQRLQGLQQQLRGFEDELILRDERTAAESQRWVDRQHRRLSQLEDLVQRVIHATRRATWRATWKLGKWRCMSFSNVLCIVLCTVAVSC